MYDIAVIGAGSGGLTAAMTAQGFGKKTLLIEKDRPGGECTWSGCIPSKALIHEAERVHTANKLIPDFGYDTKIALEEVNRVRNRVYSHETPEQLESFGIVYKKGMTSFLNSKTLSVEGEEIQAKKIIISTGSSPFIPPIEGLEQTTFHTNETFFNQTHLPKSLLILGGGPIGVEMAQAVSRLGCKVTLVEMMDIPLFREEREYAESVRDILKSEGVQFLLGAKATRVEENNSKIRLYYSQDNQEWQIEADSLLVSIGRKANTEGLELDKAGIQYTPKGIIVNPYLQTSQKNIYAIGDVVGPYQFSHMANAQGIRAVQNAILPIKRKLSYKDISWVTFTSPELARIGITEEEARQKHGSSIRIYEYDFNRLDRAMTRGETKEKIKVILNKKGYLLGASILGYRAGEMLGELQLLKTRNINFSQMAKVVHPYPTYNDVFSKIGKQVMVDNLMLNPFIRLLRRK